MRWVYFICLVLVGAVVQTSLVPVLWFRTPAGWVGPEILAAVAVFVGLYAPTATDAALAGWALGLAVDLTLSGSGMGLLALLYAAGAAGVFAVREAFFRDRVVTRMLLGALFCVFVYEIWIAYDVLIAGAGGGLGRPALLALALAAYTAVLTPLVCSGLRKVERFLLAVRPERQRR